MGRIAKKRVCTTPAIARLLRRGGTVVIGVDKGVAKAVVAHKSNVHRRQWNDLMEQMGFSASDEEDAYLFDVLEDE